MGADSHPGKLRGECVPGVPLAKPAFPVVFCTSQENILFFVCLREREREVSPSVVETRGPQERRSKAAPKGWDCCTHGGSQSKGGGFVCLGPGYKFTSATLV